MSDDIATRFDRVPPGEGTDDSPGRRAILAWWDDRFGVAPDTFEAYTFYERGRGNIWVVRGDWPTPVDIEGLGMVCLRTRGHDWKPTTNAAQRFGDAATTNVVALDRDQTARFVAGDTQPIDAPVDRGYVLAATTVAGGRAVLGVGQHLDGELRSVVPKGRRRTLDLEAGP